MANPALQSGRFCNAGHHWIDSNWDSCPYCDTDKRSKERTAVIKPFAAPLQAASDDRKTKASDAPAGVRRETRVMPSGWVPSSGTQSGERDTRRIMGILITYTWRPEGQLFPIREGKNFIGAGNVSSEATHRQCEICIPNDPKLSAEHALILCRHGRYDIVDQKSSNGTFLKDELVPLQGIELPNYAEISTGNTVWTFIKINPPASEMAPPPPNPRYEEPKSAGEESESRESRQEGSRGRTQIG